MAKTEFQATEDVELSFEPFADKSQNGDRIELGDTVTAVIKKPDGNLYTPPAFTRDPDTKIWEALIPVADFMAGKWKIRLESSNTNADPQYRTIHWGVGAVEDADLLPSVSTNASNAASNASTAATQATTAATQASAAAASALSADTKCTTIQSLAEFLSKVAKNRWKVFNNQLVYYDDDGTTPIRTWNLFDPSGNPTNTNIRERVPVP